MSAEHKGAIIQEMDECTDEIRKELLGVHELALDIVDDISALDSEQLGLLLRQIRTRLETAEQHLATRDLKVAYLAGYGYAEAPE